jgi:hypothetical protein
VQLASFILHLLIKNYIHNSVPQNKPNYCSKKSVQYTKAVPFLGVEDVTKTVTYLK